MQDKHENNTRRVSQTVVENKLPSPPSFYFSIGGVSWGWPVSKFAQSGKGIIDLFD